MKKKKVIIVILLLLAIAAALLLGFYFGVIKPKNTPPVIKKQETQGNKYIMEVLVNPRYTEKEAEAFISSVEVDESIIKRVRVIFYTKYDDTAQEQDSKNIMLQIEQAVPRDWQERKE